MAQEASSAGSGVVIIGAGQAGLATAFYLHRAGISPTLLDSQVGPGGAWRHVWPTMTLFSPSQMSNLPGMQMPPFAGFPPAQHVVDYLTAYEHRYEFRIERPVRVDEVSFDGDSYTVRAGDLQWHARHVVAATGTWSSLFVPSYPGVFPGTQWHTMNYPGVEPFVGARVAVVGGANSGAQIAAELTEVADVTWYTRGAPRWMPDDVDGRVLFAHNRRRALALGRGEPDPGGSTDFGDIVVLPRVREARDSGALTWTPMFDTLTHVSADHLIWCTGFRPALGPVRRLLTGRVPRTPRLHLVGYGDWTGPGSATITGVSPFARETARAIAADLSART